MVQTVLSGVHLAATAVFAFGLLYAAFTDVTGYRIPNGVAMALTGAFAVAAVAGGLGMGDVLDHLGAGLAVLAGGFALFWLRVMGGGDVKLMAAAATWTGLEPLPAFLLVTALAGGLVSVLLIALRRLPLPATWRGKELLSRDGGVPYGVAIAAAGLFMMVRYAGRGAFADVRLL